MPQPVQILTSWMPGTFPHRIDDTSAPLPRTAFTASESIIAVPLGLSRLLFPCISVTEMSASGKTSAASESARQMTHISGDRFTARNTGMICAAFSIFRYSLSVCPVAAITAGIFLFTAYSSVSPVADGSEKSIIAEISSVT